MATTSVQLGDLEAAEVAYDRVKDQIDAVSVDDLTPSNVDIVSATSIVLGVSDQILPYRDRIAKLQEFDVRNIDSLVDYAKAAWYLHVTNLPVPEPADAAKMVEEVAVLRAKLLRWAGPLVEEGKFDANAVAKIKEGSGSKDAPSDLVALVGLFRSNWEEVKNMCNVEEADLDRGALIGPAVFALVSRREARRAAAATPEGNLLVKRAWSLLDRAYNQCRRALSYLVGEEVDVDVLAPSLRKNSGPSAKKQPDPTPTPTPGPTSASVVEASSPEAAPIATGAVVGTGSPFAKR